MLEEQFSVNKYTKLVIPFLAIFNSHNCRFSCCRGQDVLYNKYETFIQEYLKYG